MTEGGIDRVDESPLARIPDYVDLYAKNTPDVEAAIFEHDRVTYGELQRRVDEFARALLSTGIVKGDRVAMLCTTRIEFWVCFLATVRIGAIWVGLNPRYSAEECLYVVRDATPRLLFSVSEFEGRCYGESIGQLMDSASGIEQVISIGRAPGVAVDLESFIATAAKTAMDEYQVACSSVRRTDPAMIVYTSGSTGQPKGAVIAHSGLCLGATIQASHFNVKSPSSVVNFPINHVACVADACATTLVKGGKIVFQQRFDPTATLAAIAAERCSIWGGVPTMLLMQLESRAFEQTDLSSVQLVIWGGAPMPRHAIRKLLSVCPRLMTAYGMTETSCHTTYSAEDADVEALAATIGKPDHRCPCRIMDESGQLCPVGISGELQFYGDYLMRGYWNRPEATRKTFTVDGWLRTGDLGYWRADGSISLVGRSTDMFKSGGYNVYPGEVESVIERSPAVALAAVVCVPDAMFQEVGLAFVQPKAGMTVRAEEIRVHCKKSLANYKIPKRFVILSELPLLPVGKVDKEALKRMVAQNTTTESL